MRALRIIWKRTRTATVFGGVIVPQPWRRLGERVPAGVVVAGVPQQALELHEHIVALVDGHGLDSLRLHLRVRADIIGHARINMCVNISHACFEMAD